MSDINITLLVSQGLGVAISIFLIVWVVKYLIPSMQQHFKETLDGFQLTFKESLNSIADHWKENCRQCREEHYNVVSKVLEEKNDGMS